eukprot:CAMPEP_0204361738 /NCGR_PEP_ID=MMETSP0469-20131031/39056_1 /ASSEMBLY_ACC=CAM_ASM_000384 /TAXON_ID=2969 /ORGANISM="Oxyrrhis marina" /LENGTH=57 /DNA_ID=CAMNT_0051350187 /DNA_START=303 /DNA_END=473 /DNA_ORIENTATION=-
MFFGPAAEHRRKSRRPGPTAAHRGGGQPGGAEPTREDSRGAGAPWADWLFSTCFSAQ